MNIKISPLIIDIEGTSLTAKDRKNLSNNLVAGVILFARNFTSLEQLENLVAEIKAVQERLLVTVDHEGGRVQRFRKGFSCIPPMQTLGNLFARQRDEAMLLAEDLGWLIASELLSFKIDLTYAPVLDLNYNKNTVIGDRSFASLPNTVANLSRAFMLGMQEAGMANCAKHFPGHGFVAEDTHDEVAHDCRLLDILEKNDIIPYKANITTDLIQAIMPSHIIYKDLDSKPAGFSKIWLDYLRNNLGFNGAIISDDTSMLAVNNYGNATKRVALAIESGCDLVLVCNDPSGREEILENLSTFLSNSKIFARKDMEKYAKLQRQRIANLRGHFMNYNLSDLHQTFRAQDIKRRIKSFLTKNK